MSEPTSFYVALAIVFFIGLLVFIFTVIGWRQQVKR